MTKSKKLMLKGVGFFFGGLLAVYSLQVTDIKLMWSIGYTSGALITWAIFI